MIVFTDLDGTLLDDRYSAEPARPALDALRQRGIPLVLCSSKTRIEMAPLVDELAPGSPFIVENGGAIVFATRPEGAALAGAVEHEGRWVVPLGLEASALRGVVCAIARETGLPLRGMSEMTIEEIVRATGLSPGDAARARTREWSEPFGPLNAETLAAWDALDAAARARGVTLTRGGRFFHLAGATDKGRAARVLLDAMPPEPRRRTVGLGDAPNDLTLLATVDEPIIVPRPEPDAVLRRALPHARIAPAPGPEGWNAAVLALLPTP